MHRLGLDGQTSPRLRKWIHATAAHPPLTARLTFLRHHASDADCVGMPTPAPDESVFAWCAGLGWLTSLIAGWVLGASSAMWAIGISAVLLIAISLTPLLLLQAASLGNVDRRARTRRRVYATFITLLLGVFPIMLGFAQLDVFGNIAFFQRFPWLLPAFGILYGLSVIGLLVVVIRMSVDDTSRQKLEAALQQHDFANVIRLVRRMSKPDDHARSLAAISHAVLGDQRGAIAEFERLIVAYPDTTTHHVHLASLLIEEGQFERALAVSAIMKARFPLSGLSEAISSRAFRRLGRLEDSRREIERAMELMTYQGAAWAATAGVAIDRGDYESARSLLQIANEKTPGTVQELVEAARLSWLTESKEIATTKIRRAIAALQDDPLLLRLTDLATLNAKLVELGVSDGNC